MNMKCPTLSRLYSLATVNNMLINNKPQYDVFISLMVLTDFQGDLSVSALGFPEVSLPLFTFLIVIIIIIITSSNQRLGVRSLPVIIVVCY